MTQKTISKLLDEIWGDVKKDRGKTDYAVRKTKTLQRMRWLIGDILTEFSKDKKKGLEMARDVLIEDE